MHRRADAHNQMRNHAHAHARTRSPAHGHVPHTHAGTRTAHTRTLTHATRTRTRKSAYALVRTHASAHARANADAHLDMYVQARLCRRACASSSLKRRPLGQMRARLLLWQDSIRLRVSAHCSNTWWKHSLPFSSHRSRTCLFALTHELPPHGWHGFQVPGQFDPWALATPLVNHFCP
eukprot:6174049-Pleurochrysis_carterae.AAC.2